jgi:hypothetical protein
VRLIEFGVYLTLLSLVLISCKAFDETLLEPRDAGPGCDLKRPPLRPEGADDPGDGTTFVYAIRGITLDQNEGRWRTIGYDLDGICSEPRGDPPEVRVECRAPSPSAPPAEDGERGTDNALGAEVLPLFLIGMPDLPEVTQADQSKGVGVALITITGWNGEDDDPQVQVVFAQSAFGTTVPPERVDSFGYDLVDRTLFVNGEPWPAPEWAGEDHWYARSDNFLEGDIDRPRISDDNAYVTGGTLVMRLPDRFPLTFSGQLLTTTFLLSDAYFTVDISPDRQSVDRAIMAGRFATLDILETIRGAGVCPGSDDYDSLSRLLDLAADIRTVPGTGGPGAVCDALSVGFLYESGVAATIEGVADPLTPADLCADGGMPDGGMDGGVEGGMPDASAPDSGMPDSGTPDSGTDDSGIADSGMDALDAGVPMDAPPD